MTDVQEKKSKALAAAIERAKEAETEADLFAAAGPVDKSYGDGTEFNFPAEIIMYLDMAQARPGSPHPTAAILKSAEETMLQLAFINAGEQPPCAFIMAAHGAGWRYHPGLGFHKVAV